MATIGTFKKTGNGGYAGEIATLNVQIAGVHIIPGSRTDGENAPIMLRRGARP